jgi:Tn3 transposase DDE domain-containing protein
MAAPSSTYRLTATIYKLREIERTLFILRYLQSADYRRRIHTQLNKGESLHALRDFLFMGDKGVIRRKQYEAQTNQALCLNVVTNAVIIWNTVYMQAALDQLRGEGYRVHEEDVAHLSPARFEHIKVLSQVFIHDPLRYDLLLSPTANRGERRWRSALRGRIFHRRSFSWACAGTWPIP